MKLNKSLVEMYDRQGQLIFPRSQCPGMKCNCSARYVSIRAETSADLEYSHNAQSYPLFHTCDYAKGFFTVSLQYKNANVANFVSALSLKSTTCSPM